MGSRDRSRTSEASERRDRTAQRTTLDCEPGSTEVDDGNVWTPLAAATAATAATAAPRRAAPRRAPRNTDERRPTPAAAAGPHWRINESERTDTRTRGTQSWTAVAAPLRLASTASCPAPAAAPFSSPSPSSSLAATLPSPPSRASQGRRPTGARKRLSRSLWVTKKRESVSVFPFDSALFPKAVKKIQSYHSRRRRPRRSAVLSFPRFVSRGARSSIRKFRQISPMTVRDPLHSILVAATVVGFRYDFV